MGTDKRGMSWVQIRDVMDSWVQIRERVQIRDVMGTDQGCHGLMGTEESGYRSGMSRVQIRDVMDSWVQIRERVQIRDV